MPCKYGAAAAQQQHGEQQQDQEQQGQEQQQPLVLDTSPKGIWRALKARLAAGERNIPAPQQAQLGPLPLWQQCLLEVASQCGGMRAPRRFHMYAAVSSGLHAAQDGVKALQWLLDEYLTANGGDNAMPFAIQPWGMVAAQAAVELRQPQLLAWALQPEQRERLWGSVPDAATVALTLFVKDWWSPLKCKLSADPEQQRADLQELQQHQQQQVPGRPAFAQSIGDIGLMMLSSQHKEAAAASTAVRASEALLNRSANDWLEHGVQHNSSKADVARAKAVLAAVAAAKEVPAGARILRKEALFRVAGTCDRRGSAGTVHVLGQPLAVMHCCTW
jgi:hypothetical protein